MKNAFFRIWRLLLPFIFLFTLVHFLKDITQDILKVPTPLDIFGDIKEDLSFFPSFFRPIFYYELGILSLVAEIFLLISIPKVWRKKSFTKLDKWIAVGILFLIVYIFTCLILDPRFNFLN